MMQLDANAECLFIISAVMPIFFVIFLHNKIIYSCNKW